MTRARHHLIPLSLTLILVILDRLTKQIVVQSMEYGQSIPFLGDVVRWTYIHNYGMAFGMDLTGGEVLGWVSVVAVVVILMVFLRTPPENAGSRWVLAAVLGGALGNTYDRIAYGYVIDFVDVDLPAFVTGMDRWPVFNVADSAVSVGVVLLIVMMFLPRRSEAAVEAGATTAFDGETPPDPERDAAEAADDDAEAERPAIAEDGDLEDESAGDRTELTEEGSGEDPAPDNSDTREGRS